MLAKRSRLPDSEPSTGSEPPARRYGGGAAFARHVPSSNLGPGRKPEINVTPLVDVCLVLLIIFMVIAPQLEAGERVELPAIKNVDAHSKLNSTTLTMTLTGKYMLEKEFLEETQIADRLSELHKREPERRLVVKADRLAGYGKVRSLFEKAQNIGFPGVALMVDQTRPDKGPQ